MHRRAFNLSLCAATIAAGGLMPLSSEANKGRQKKDSSAPATGHVSVSIDGRQVLISAVLISTPRQTLGVTLDRAIAQFDEGRLDLGRLPLIGQFTRPTLQKRLAAAQPLGKVVLVGRALVLVPDVRDLPPTQSVLIAHRDKSWEVPSAPRPVRLSGLPVLGDLMKYRERGRGYVSGNSLMILVRPTLVREPAT